VIRLLLALLGLVAASGASAPATSDCSARTFEGARFTICRYDAGRDRLRLVSAANVRSFDALRRALGPEAERVRFAMNAGMFDNRGAPIGLFVANGTVVHPINLNRGWGNFHLLPNGVFSADAAGRPSVSESRNYAAAGRHDAWATQSGPMLVIDGKLHPRFDPNGASQLVRNGVGVADGRTAYFVISDDPVSFGRLARLFRDALGCRNALYLDGNVSSLWYPAGRRQDPTSRLGPFVVVLSGRE
jgi:uncharacterized protein YigE (DUF2233 family)